MKKFIKLLFQNMHWILAVFLVVYTIIPFLSPILFDTGHIRLGWYIQTVFQFLCHQRPERSLFLFGEKLTYSLKELMEYGYNGNIKGYTFIGNEIVGYKVAFCIRDTFLYGSMGITGLIVSAWNKRLVIPWYALLLLTAPMMLDGGIQFISELLFLSQGKTGFDLANPFYLSNNVTRAITGTLFGTGVSIFLFSELKEALQDGN